MKRIKSINGYTIYQATARDVTRHNVEEGYFYLYFSSDIREYGLAYSYIEMEAGSLEEAEALATGSNYAAAREYVETYTTAATFEEVAEIEARLDAGMTLEEIEEAAEEEEAETTTNNKEEKTMKTRKSYLNHRTDETTASATQAMQWYRAGDLVQVNTYYNEPGKKTGLANVVHVPGAKQPARTAEDENRSHCKHIAQELDAYVNDEVKRCPECGEIHRRDWGQVGDLFKCPNCGEVTSLDDWEWLSIWDFLSDVYDVEYRCGSDREYRSVRIMVACGGPNIYLNTATKDVELYWWNERSRYPMSYEAAEALDQWAEDCWNM